jgi:hypothetical protein
MQPAVIATVMLVSKLNKQGSSQWGASFECFGSFNVAWNCKNLSANCFWNFFIPTHTDWPSVFQRWELDFLGRDAAECL